MRKLLAYVLMLLAPFGAQAIDVTVVPEDEVLQEATVAYDPYQGAMLVKSYGFEGQDDRDFDDQPDDWLRREGVEFPRYVTMEIDRTRAASGSQSLRVDANGGKAVYYSPPIRIDDLHAFVFQARVFTKGLSNDAAILSLSFLNDQRQRVQRFLSRPISGNTPSWQTMQIGPVTPVDEVCFAVIGVHLVHSEKMDISGSAWVDDVWLGKLPRFYLESNFETHFRQTKAPISIKSYVTGLDAGPVDAGYVYQLFLKVRNVDGKLIGRRTFLLRPNVEQGGEGAGEVQQAIAWDLPPQPPGFYRVSSQLQREGQVIMRKETSFAVMDLVGNANVQGEFGLSVPGGAERLSSPGFVSIMVESGVNCVKYPLWDHIEHTDVVRQTFIGSLLDGLEEKGITTVGLLNHPPEELRKQFPSDWQGVSEIFTMTPAFWKYSIDDVMAKYSGNVRFWQLGDDDDTSFIGRGELTTILSLIKTEFDRMGRDTRVGMHWDWQQPLPSSDRANEFFVSVGSQESLTPAQIAGKLKTTSGQGFERWVQLTPLPVHGEHAVPTQQRASDLVHRMIASKVGGAERIMLTNVFDSQTGLLYDDGSPTELFVPWRTTAIALRAAEYLGSLQFPNGSLNYVFSHNGEATIVIWNPEATSQAPIIEELYLGEEVEAVSIWGQREKLRPSRGSGQKIAVTPYPQFLVYASDAVVRLMMSVRFEKGRIPSSTDYHAEAILGKNTFPTGTSGRLEFHPPKEWDVDPKVFDFGLARGEEFRMPLTIKLPASTSLGKRLLPITFYLEDGQIELKVYREYEIGLGDVELSVEVFPDVANRRLIVEQTIFNNTQPPEQLDFRCSLDVRGRRRQYKHVTKLDGGQTIKKTFYIEDPHTMTDFMLKLRAEQIDGRRVLNYIWTPEQIPGS